METFKNPLVESADLQKIAEPCILIIFGASGDLTRRKLMPALYNLKREGALPAQFATVGFARREKSHEEFRLEMKDGIKEFSRVKPLDENLYETFSENTFYHKSAFDDDAGYLSLKEFLLSLDKKLGTKGNRIFYLSTQPSEFTLICQKLKEHGLIYSNTEKNLFSRVIIEKPFGHDLESSLTLQTNLTKYLDESQIYRIDHYLGKETVQNLLVFRFANSIYESLWNHRYIENIQITVAEDFGVGTRGKFWEESGLVRDIIQNHVMQLVTLVAMEPPSNFSPESIRNEKVKVLESIRPIDLTQTSRGQYVKGLVNGSLSKSYREESNVDPLSNVETFGAMRLYIDNWRFSSVPFYIRAGKNLPRRVTEIAITFKESPDFFFKNSGANVLAIRIQPDEGISLKMNAKIPGQSNVIQPVKMDFRYSSFFGMSPPDAYERLIWDCMAGDSTLFARVDEVTHSWRLMTPLLHHWQDSKDKGLEFYQAGTWGPSSADLLLCPSHKWRCP